MSEAWLELWAEHGFAEPNAIGKRGASRTQVQMATEASDESLDIDQAVNKGHLQEQTQVAPDGKKKPVWYRLNLAGGVQA